MPSGGQVVGGQAAISQNGAAMRIEQSSARAAIDWQSFNVGAGASVTFNQPSSSAIALNRVLGASGSEIYGRLSANGQVFLINPNGVLFGRGAQVDVGGLVASTLGLSAEDFMLGRYSLRGGAAGSVVNQGTIRAHDGSVALLAPNITNDGLIEAQRGAISLTAASAATVDFMADGLVRIRVDEGALQAEIANNGVLRADGGTITLTAKSLDNLARAVINNTGIIEARTVEDVSGVVRLGGGDVYVSGTIDVSSADGVGGSAHVLGERVALLGNARIDASGALGGGEVLIGGDLGGRNPEIQNAQYTYIGADAAVLAEARAAGDGGKVVAWADGVTQVYGSISVRGGAASGNGGFVETSGQRHLDVRQAPDLRAPLGQAGTWLLDPETINIEASADFNISTSSPFQPGLLTLPSVLNINTLNNALNQGGSVIVDTTNLLGLSAGDINVNAPIAKSAGANSTLELRAHNDININQNITSSNNALNLVLNANQDGTGGIVNIANNVTLNTAGGTINASGETVNMGTARIVAPLFRAGALNLSPGTLTVTGDVDVTGALNWSGGIMTGAGNTLVRGPLAITGAVGLDAGRILDVQGSANWTAGDINLNPTAAVGSGVIVNRAGSIFSTNFDGLMLTQNFGTGDDGTSARFDNLGTFQKTGGIATSAIATAFNNSGGLDVQSGTVWLQQGGTHAGSFTGAGTLQFGGGAHVLTSTSSVTVANATFSAGTADVGGTYSIAGTTRVNGGSASFTGTLASLGSALDITSGVADLRGANATVASFKQSGGTLSGTSSLTVSGATTLSGGSMSGSGSTITQAPLAISGSISLDAGRVLDVQGGATWTAGNINLNSTNAAGSGTIVNRAGSTFSTSFDGAMFTQNFGTGDNGTSALFDNLGTFQKTGGTGTTSITNRFNNVGALNVNSGTVNLQQGGTHAGSFGGTGTIEFGGGTHALGSTSIVTTKNTKFSGGTVDIAGIYDVIGKTSISAGTASFAAAARTQELIQSGGTLSGTGTLRVDASTVLSGGTMSGAGVTLTHGPMSITGPIALDAGRVLDIHGDVNWSAGSINLNGSSAQGSGTIVSRATFNTNFNGSMFTQNFGGGDNGTSALFENRGTFLNTASGTTSIQNVFDNRGTLDVRTGTVNLQRGGTHGGDFAVASGATLQFSGGTHNVAGTSTQPSSGRLLVTGGILNVNVGGSFANQGLFEVTGGALNVDGAASTVSYKQSAGTLSGVGSLTVSGAATLSGGTITGSGSTITQGPLAINGSVALDAGRVLDIQGGATWTAGSINLNATGAAGSGTIINRAGSTFTTSFDGSMFTQNFGGTDNGSSALFNNLGTFQKSAGAGTTTVQNAFSNAGTLSVGAGDVSLTAFPSNAGTITLANGASVTLNASLTNTVSGVISGNGTVDLGSFTLTNDGTIAAGASVATLNIVGNLAMGATGIVHTEAQSPWTTGGGDFDLINVSGSAALGGTLRLDHVDARAPAEGQLMQVINAGTVTGAFASVAAPSGSTYTVLYNPADVTVRHEFTVAPVTVSGSLGFEPSTVGTMPVPSSESEMTQLASSAAPLVALSVKQAFVLPDLSHIMASMSELRRKKVDAVEDAVRILERNPNAADLPPCVGEPSGNCIAERPARFEPGEGAPGAAPELAHLWGIERKYALLIGVNEYRDPMPQLGSPLKDIAEIAALYRSQFGYEVRTLPNADKASIVREINRLILETGPNDSVVVFYAGHGHVVEKTGRGYWIPGKAGGDDPKQWISNSDIAKMLANIPARQVLLVSDSCYSGTLAREGKIEKSDVLTDPRAVLQRRAVTVLTSGGEEPVADAGKDGHSVFAWHFIRTLGRVAQWSSGLDVYERLAETVQLDFPQTPQYGAALGAGHEAGADYLFEVRRY